MKTHYYCDDIVKLCDDKHLTVDEIFQEISLLYPDAGKSSIYRNVERLAAEWKLRKLCWVWKKSYFEKEKWDHIHLIDNSSGQIIDLPECFTFPWLPKDFKVTGMDIKIYGDFK